MILVDTNIIIDFWKRPTEKAQNIFEAEEIAICGITEAELIHGAKSEKEINIIIEALEDFNMFEITESDWIEIGKLLNRIKKKGISVPFQDAVIAYLAIKNSSELWTNDKHFKMIQSEIKELKIFKLEKGE